MKPQTYALLIAAAGWCSQNDLLFKEQTLSIRLPSQEQPPPSIRAVGLRGQERARS